jgi:electron transfer flavoprotein alpha subunit
MKTTIISESSNGSLHPITSQLVGAASSLGSTITVICPGGIGHTDAAQISGVSKVISAEGKCFDTYDCIAWSKSLTPLVQGDLILSSSSAIGRELVSSIAASKGIPSIQDVTSLEDGLIVTRSIYSGKAIEEVTISSPCAISLRANSFESAGSGGSAEISIVNVSQDVTVAVKQALAKAEERLDVSDADIIISGGRGMGGPENFSHLYEIADVLGAAVGASRAAVDTWEDIPHSMQVGQTGKTVTPNLYIAVGISGAIQHLAGMRSSKYILAINKDPEAPIFGVADYGIVATWEEALPVLKDQLSKILSN